MLNSRGHGVCGTGVCFKEDVGMCSFHDWDMFFACGGIILGF